MNHTMLLKFIFLYFLRKTKHVSDETSSIASCIMRNSRGIAENGITKLLPFKRVRLHPRVRRAIMKIKVFISIM